MNTNLELKLQAWLDGELSDSDARAMSDAVANNADAHQLVTDLRALKGIMHGNEMAPPVPETRDFYWSKIQRQIEREAHTAPALQNSRQPVMVRWLSSLAGFAAMTSMLVLAVRPFAPPAFDEISSTGEGMEAVTFHDQSAGLTVVWLANNETAPPTETPEIKAPELSGDTESEME